MRVPIFSGKGIYLGCLSWDNFPRENAKNEMVLTNLSRQIFRGIFSKTSQEIKKWEPEPKEKKRKERTNSI